MLARKAEGAEPALRTARLSLAPLGPAHADLHPLIADFEIVRNLATAPWPYPRDTFDDYLRGSEARAGDADNFAVLLGAAPIGVVGVKRPGTGDPPRIMPRLGYWIGRPYWGAGYATEAVKALTEHAFAAFEAERVGAGVFADNPASARVLENLGFKEMRRYPTPCLARGEAVETIDMQITWAKWSATWSGRR